VKTRFKKVWCESCHSMQFAGECPHGRVVADPLPDKAKDFYEYYRLAKSDCRADFSVPLTVKPSPLRDRGR